jgi:RecB family exonuclease
VRTFGTKDNPLRMSALPALVQCGWRAVLLAEAMLEDTSGVAADTGSALHKGAAEWHTTGKDELRAIKALRESIAEFPLADLEDAEKQFHAYITDPRNRSAQLLCVEQKVELTIDPSPEDVTGEPIHVRGTLDQIRMGDDGIPRVWDIKTGKRPISFILHAYTFQLAGYTLAAAQFVPNVQPGGFICTRNYLKRGVDPASAPDGVFVEVPWNIAHCDKLLDAVRNQVALIRAGRAHVGPGEHCSYCPARGIDFCLPALVERSKQCQQSR